jgi:hypothetical protein
MMVAVGTAEVIQLFYEVKHAVTAYGELTHSGRKMAITGVRVNLNLKCEKPMVCAAADIITATDELTAQTRYGRTKT